MENINEEARKHIKILEIGQRVKVSKIFHDNNEYIIVDKHAHPSGCAVDYKMVLPEYVREYETNRTVFTEDRTHVLYNDEMVGYYNITGDAYFDGDYAESGITLC